MLKEDFKSIEEYDVDTIHTCPYSSDCCGWTCQLLSGLRNPEEVFTDLEAGEYINKSRPRGLMKRFLTKVKSSNMYLSGLCPDTINLKWGEKKGSLVHWNFLCLTGTKHYKYLFSFISFSKTSNDIYRIRQTKEGRKEETSSSSSNSDRCEIL